MSAATSRTGYPVGFVAAITVTEVAVAAHGTVSPWWTFAALAGTAAVSGFAAATVVRARGTGVLRS